MQSVNNQTCFYFKYPFLQGGVTADSKFTSFDRDSLGNFIIGASSSSSDLISTVTPPNPYIIYVNTIGVIEWTKQFPTVFDSVESVKFDLQNSGNIVAFLNYNVAQSSMVAIFKNDGTQLYMYQLTYTYVLASVAQTSNFAFTIAQDSIIYSGSNLILGGKNQANNYGILKFQIGLPPVILQYQVELNTGSANALYLLDNLNYFAVGCNAKDTVSQVLLVSKYSETSQTQTTSPNMAHFGLAQTYSTTNQFCLKRLDVSPGVRLVALSDNLDNTQGISFTTCTLTAANLFNLCKNYPIKLGTSKMRAITIKIIGVNEFWAYITLSASYRAVKFTTAGYTLISLPINSGTLTHGYIISGTQGFYLGWQKTFQNIPTITTYAYTYNVGFLMEYTLDSTSCIQFTYVVPAATSFLTVANLVSYTPPSTTTPWASGLSSVVLSLVDASFLASSLLSSSTIAKPWCTNDQILAAATIPNQVYQVNQIPLTFSFSEFQTQATCTDSIWTYTVVRMITTTANPLPSCITYSAKSFTVTSNTNTDAGIYTIKVTGMLQNKQIISATFTITINADPCVTANVISTLPITTPQSYSIYLGTSQILGSTAWTQSVGTCPTIVYSIKNSDGTADISGIFSISGTDVQVNTQSTLKKGTYSMMLQGVQTTYQTKSVVFVVNVIDDCDNNVLTTVPITTPQSYSINLGTSKILGTTAWTQSLTICPPIAYSIKNSDGTSDLSGIFSISGTDLLVNTQSVLKKGTYNMMLLGVQTTYQTKSVVFIVNVIDDCDNNVLNTVPITTPQQYDIRSGSNLILGITNWSQTVSTCSSINYSILKQADSQPADSFFFLQALNIVVNTQSALKLGTYNLLLLGQIPGYSTTASFPFVVEIIDSCLSATIQTNNIPNTIYDIQMNNLFIAVDPGTSWTISNSACPVLSYSIIDLDTMLTPDSIFNINSITGIVQVQTNNYAKIKIYSLRLTAMISGLTGIVKNFEDFQVNVVDSCNDVLISKNSFLSPQQYDIKLNTSLSLGSLSWTRDLVYCPVITYTVLNATNNLPIDNIFTYQSGVLSIYTNDTSNIGVKSIIITGSIIGTYKTYNQDSVIIEVNIIDSYQTPIIDFCNQTQILPQNFTNFTLYDIANGTQIITSLQNWTQTMPNCSSITYQILDASTNKSYSSLFYINSNQDLTVFTQDQKDQEFYKLKLIASVSIYAKVIVYFDVQIIDCRQQRIQSSDIQNMTYYIGQDPMVFSFREWKNTIQYCGQVKYELRVYPPTDSVSQRQNTISIASLQSKDIGQYRVLLYGFITKDIYRFIEFYVNILPVINTAPYFQNIKIQGLIESLFVPIDTVYIYSLPQILDNQNDQVSINLTLSPSFVKLNSKNKTIIVSPLSGDNGFNNIKINLTDNGKPQLSSQYFIHILVPQQILKIPEVKNNTVIQNKTYPPLNATILDFSERGIVRIKLDGIEKYNLYKGKRILENQDDNLIALVFYLNNDYSYQISNYTILSYVNGVLEIQLHIDNPLILSKTQNHDLITVQPILINYPDIQFGKASEYIPSQIPISGKLEHLHANQDKLSIGLSYLLLVLIILLLLISLIWYDSLSALWSYINSLQMILYISLFNIVVPSNLMHYFKAFFPVANLNLFNPIDFHQKLYLLPNPEDMAPYNLNFKGLGFITTNLIYNLGLVFLLIEIYVICMPLIYLLTQLKFIKNKLFKRIVAGLSQHFFFSATSRFIIQTSLFTMAFSVLSIKDDFKRNNDKEASFGLAFMFMMIYPLSLILLTAWIWFLYRRNLIFSRTRSAIRNLLYDLDKKKKLSTITFYMIQMIRRCIIVSIIFGLEEQLVIQLVIFQAFSIAQVIYTQQIKPLECQNLNRLELLNQFFVLFIGQLFFVFTDVHQKQPDTKYIFGFIIIIFCMVHLILNVAYIAYFTLMPFFIALTKLIYNFFQVSEEQNPRKSFVELIQIQYDSPGKTREDINSIAGSSNDKMREIDTYGLSRNNLGKFNSSYRNSPLHPESQDTYTHTDTQSNFMTSRGLLKSSVILREPRQSTGNQELAFENNSFERENYDDNIHAVYADDVLNNSDLIIKNRMLRNSTENLICQSADPQPYRGKQQKIILKAQEEQEVIDEVELQQEKEEIKEEKKQKIDDQISLSRVEEELSIMQQSEKEDQNKPTLIRQFSEINDIQIDTNPAEEENKEAQAQEIEQTIVMPFRDMFYELEEKVITEAKEIKKEKKLSQISEEVSQIKKLSQNSDFVPKSQKRISLKESKVSVVESDYTEFYFQSQQSDQIEEQKEEKMRKLVPNAPQRQTSSLVNDKRWILPQARNSDIQNNLPIIANRQRELNNKSKSVKYDIKAFEKQNNFMQFHKQTLPNVEEEWDVITEIDKKKRILEEEQLKLESSGSFMDSWEFNN